MLIGVSRLSRKPEKIPRGNCIWTIVPARDKYQCYCCSMLPNIGCVATALRVGLVGRLDLNFNLMSSRET